MMVAALRVRAGVSVPRWWWLVVAVAVGRAALLAVLVPPYQASDEPWHVDRARVLATGQLGVLGRTPAGAEVLAHQQQVAANRGLRAYAEGPWSREVFQPPLAYLPTAVAWRAGADPPTALVVGRAVDVLFGGLAAVAALWMARRALPHQPAAAVTSGLVAATLPSLGAVAGSANNDALLVVVACLLVGGAAGVARTRAASARTAVGLGVGVGAAGLVKANGLLLAAPVLVGLWWSSPRWRRLAAAATGAVAVAGWWLLRNVAVYGDPLGTSAFAAFGPAPGRTLGGWRLLLGGQPTHPDAGPLWSELWRTTVGAFGWTDLWLPGWVYALSGVLTLLGVAAALRWWRRATAADRRAAVTLLSALPPLLAATLWFAFTVDWQPQGRYLLPGVLPVVAVLGAGLGRRGLTVVGCLGAVWVATSLLVVVGAYR